MANYLKLKPIILRFEGLYAGNIDGMICTMKGVTLATYQAYCKKKGLRQPNCVDLRRIPDEHWNEIFKTMYWDRCKGDDIINQSIANIIVDWCWASGTIGIKLAQQTIGVKADGIIGNKTIDAINNYPNQSELFRKLWNRRKKHFEDIARGNKAKFLKGWLNRLNAFKYE